MRRKERRIFFFVLAAVVCVVAIADMRAETAKRKKARYYYTAGAIQKACGNEDAAYEYFKRSYNTDPDYAEAAIACGMSRLELPLDTMQSDTEINRSLAMMRQYVDQYPDDVNEAQYYGYVATQLGQPGEAVRVLERTYAENPTVSATLLQLSDAYAVNKDLDKAIDAIDRYEKSEGMAPQLTTRKISYMLVNKDTVGAIREVTRLVATDPRNVSYNILKGNLFDVIEKKDSALYYYLKAEQLDPESGSAKMSLASYYKEANDSVAFDNKMYEVLLSEDLDLDMKSDLLAQYLQELVSGKQDTQRGDYLFSVLQNQYPHEPRLLDLAARYNAAKSDLETAIEDISYALDLDPTNYTYWGQLMAYQASAHRYDESFQTYERSKTHIVPQEDMKTFYAMIAQTAKRYDLAVNIYREMIDSIQPGLAVDSVLTLRDVRRDISLEELDKLSRLVASLGDLYHSAGDNQMAYRMYDNALTFDSSNALAANNYAYFLSIDGGDLQRAAELSRKSLFGENANNPTFLDTYAWINYQKGDYATALEYQEKALGQDALERGPLSGEFYDHYGDILAKLDRLSDAYDAWRIAAEKMEEDEETDEPEYGKLLKKIEEAKPTVEKIRAERGEKEENTENAENTGNTEKEDNTARGVIPEKEEQQ